MDKSILQNAINAREEIDVMKKKRAPLLRCALHRGFFIIFFIVLPSRAPLRIVAAEILNVAFGVVVNFINWASLDARPRLGENLTKFLHHCWTGLPFVIGELDVDCQVKVSTAFAALNRHAFSGNLQNLARRENRAWSLGVVDFDTAAIKVFQHHTRESSQSFSQSNINGGLQIGTSPSEYRMLLFNNKEDDISGLLFGLLVCLSFQNNLVTLSVIGVSL